MSAQLAPWGPRAAWAEDLSGHVDPLDSNLIHNWVGRWTYALRGGCVEEKAGAAQNPTPCPLRFTNLSCWV